MSDFNRIFSALKVHFAPRLDWINVDDCLCDDDNDDEETRRGARKFWSLPMCKQNTQTQDHQLQTLRDLSNFIRSIRSYDNETQGGYDVASDNWANIENISSKEYLAYIYAVTSLATLPQAIVAAAPTPLNANINIQLATNAISTYFLTLTIRGAKSYGVFDEGVIEHCLKVFKLLEQNIDGGVRANNIWILFLTIFDDIKILFRYVHFKDHLTPRDNIIRSVVEILYMNHRLGYKNSCEY